MNQAVFFLLFCFVLFCFCFCLFFVLFCFVVGGGGAFTARQDYFTHFEPNQSLGGAKMGDPREKNPDHPQTELGLSHMWPELGSNP